MIVSAAIVLPLILDGERPPELGVQVHVSDPPAFPVVKISPVQPIDEPVQNTSTKQDTPVATEKTPQEISLLPVPSKSVDMKSETKKEVVSSKETPPSITPAERWTVQIATFKNQDNAVRLEGKLKEAGFPAYRMTTNSLYKVYVGPELSRATSEKTQESIKKQFKLSGIVIKFSEN